MSKGQEHNNRSQGQRIRRNKENIGGLIEVQEQQGQLIGQHDRDIKMMRARQDEMKARLDALERDRARD